MGQKPKPPVDRWLLVIRLPTNGYPQNGPGAENPFGQKILLETGAEVDSQENRGWTPLHDAVRFASANTARALPEAGGRPDGNERR